MSVRIHLFAMNGTSAEVDEYLALLTEEDEWLQGKPEIHEESARTHRDRVDRIDALRDKLTENKAGNSIFIGEVSWLKAALFRSPDKHVPRPIQDMAVLFQAAPVVDPELIVAAHRAMSRGNTTTYSVADPDEIAGWLGELIGCRVRHESL